MKALRVGVFTHLEKRSILESSGHRYGA